MEKVKVLLAEDHSVVREGIRALLRPEVDIEIIGEASTGLQAVELAKSSRPDVIVMDIGMPGLNGLDATRQIARAVPQAKVLVLSSYDDWECVEKLIEAGAKGFLSKKAAACELADAIRAVRRSKEYFSAEITKALQRRKLAAQRMARPGCNPCALTTREEEVLQLIAEGFPNKGVSAQLGISIKTVEKHRQKVMDKLGIHEVAGLTRYAIKRGLVPEKIPVANAPTPPEPLLP
ncbi:MAG TPA: response regulator transcription factor [Verrucomicrobiae bacterium]|nr:response regulator transcription factor [Verrucomicrobiae bacterium]